MAAFAAAVHRGVLWNRRATTTETNAEASPESDRVRREGGFERRDGFPGADFAESGGGGASEFPGAGSVARAGVAVPRASECGGVSRE